MTGRQHNIDPAAPLEPLAEDANPLDRAMLHLEQSRRAVNDITRICNAIRASLEDEDRDTTDDDLVVGLAAHLVAAVYGPLSAIGNALVKIAEQGEATPIGVVVNTNADDARGLAAELAREMGGQS